MRGAGVARKGPTHQALVPHRPRQMCKNMRPSSIRIPTRHRSPSGRRPLRYSNTCPQQHEPPRGRAIARGHPPRSGHGAHNPTCGGAWHEHCKTTEAYVVGHTEPSNPNVTTATQARARASAQSGLLRWCWQHATRLTIRECFIWVSVLGAIMSGCQAARGLQPWPTSMRSSSSSPYARQYN